jgi:hypothetical protein
LIGGGGDALHSEVHQPEEHTGDEKGQAQLYAHAHRPAPVALELARDVVGGGELGQTSQGRVLRVFIGLARRSDGDKQQQQQQT